MLNRSGRTLILCTFLIYHMNTKAGPNSEPDLNSNPIHSLNPNHSRKLKIGSVERGICPIAALYLMKAEL